MKRIFLPATVVAIVLVSSIHAATLPGFRIAPFAATAGFCSSLAFDSRGILYYTTTQGGVFRLDNGTSTKLAQMPTEFIGNAGLLGMALLDDSTAVVHYTKFSTIGTYGPAYEVISKVDLISGAETVMAEVPDDMTLPGRAVSYEHHGGIPAIGDNGSVYVGIGDFYAFAIAANPDWYAGKILRVDANGQVAKVASGFRNPYSLVWDAPNKRLIVSDNGEGPDDEINIVTSDGGFFGWPFTMGNGTPYPGAVPPIFTFPQVVVPTGMTALSGRNEFLARGYLFGAYETKAIYYVPDIDARPLPDPIALIAFIEGETSQVIDVAEAPNGDIYFAIETSIYRLFMPRRGDCNGDGLIDINDMEALTRELADGDPHPTIAAQNGSYAGSWGCDANGDGAISSADYAALAALIRTRVRAVRAWR